MDGAELPLNVAVTAQKVAAELEARGYDYALGGAIALGFWANPRGTLDVDFTIFIPVERASECVRLLQQIGCQFSASKALTMLREHGLCHVELDKVPLDVFLPGIDFYDAARPRRRKMLLGSREVMAWDAEPLIVFKMMFFRPQDLVDIAAILSQQGPALDRAWVRDQLVEIFGQRDLRIARWDELAGEHPI
ncbi:MAG TPA: hypothetical protein VMP01_21780 [Pirellulaceae bacterium]|nr:hypothetical protein [Pirellulaceae bacterium]